MAKHSPAKLALLIGCPDNLKGTETDIKRMSQLLSSPELGFEIRICQGSSSTREEIFIQFRSVLNWAKLTGGPDSVVIIYYSGHGGLVKLPAPLRNCQYLVPSDYKGGEKVILDMEISHFLTELTTATKNVTIIFDCCHSGRMARIGRYPEQKSRYATASPKNENILRESVMNYIQGTKSGGKGYMEGNPNTVRIMAAAPNEEAWELSHDGEVGGVLTRHLTNALRTAFGKKLSWNTLMKWVEKMVTTEISSQHPRGEGPITRVLFELTTNDSRSHRATMVKGEPFLDAGYVNGVKVGSVYTVMPHGFEDSDDRHKIGEVRVLAVQGFRSRCEFIGHSGQGTMNDAALAFLREDTMHQWVVEYPKGNQDLETRLLNMPFLCPRAKVSSEAPSIHQALGTRQEMVFACHDLALSQLELALANFELMLAHDVHGDMPRGLELREFKLMLAKHKLAMSLYKVSLAETQQTSVQTETTTEEPALVEIRMDGTLLSLHLRDKTCCFSKNLNDLTLSSHTATLDEAVQRAHQIAKAQHLLTLSSGEGDEELKHTLQITLGTVEKNDCKPIPDDGTGRIYRGQNYYITLRNQDKDQTLYVTVFHVDAAGEVDHITASWASGVRLKAKSYTVGEKDFGNGEIDGRRIIGAEYIPEKEPQGSTFVFIITSEEVDVRHFQTRPHTGRAADTESRLGLRAWQMGNRNRPAEADVRPKQIAYDVRRVPYTYYDTLPVEPVRIAS